MTSPEDYSVVVPTLDDWESLKQYWLDFKAGPHGERIEGDLDTFGCFFASSLCKSEIWILVLKKKEEIKGFTICHLTTASQVSQDKRHVELVPAAFIRAIVMSPGAGLSSNQIVSDFFYSHVESKARAMRCVMITGNCRLGHKLLASEHRYGFQAQYLVVSKHLT